MPFAAFFADDPRPQRPWRTVAHMLRVAAGQVSYPVLLLVPMKADDRGWLAPIHFSRVVHLPAPPLPSYKA